MSCLVSPALDASGNINGSLCIENGNIATVDTKRAGGRRRYRCRRSVGKWFWRFRCRGGRVLLAVDDNGKNLKSTSTVILSALKSNVQVGRDDVDVGAVRT